MGVGMSVPTPSSEDDSCSRSGLRVEGQALGRMASSSSEDDSSELGSCFRV